MLKPFCLIAALAAMGCTTHAAEPLPFDAVAAEAKAGIDFVDNAHIQARQAANKDLLLIDVRTASEFELGHIPGATWIPRRRSEFEIAKTVRDANTEIILYCKTGSRAALVKKALDAQGYNNVSAHAGFETWANAGLPFSNALGTVQLIAQPAE
ncbi:MAG: rhodanese-like domain-containing protein [Pseudomonadota bacterium]